MDSFTDAHADALGSIIALTDANGALRTQYNYSPFGVTQVIGEASDNPFQFTGRENDGTGLYYYRARYYSPEMGRFISEDPIGFAGGINYFAYVGNAPVNFVDPWGLFGTSDFVKHYYFGRGVPIDLYIVGLRNQFITAPSVVNATRDFVHQVQLAAQLKALALSNKKGDSSQTILCSISDTTITDVTNEPDLFAIGHSTLFRSANCSITANYARGQYTYSCNLFYAIRDKFKDPLGIGIEVGGMPYGINLDWTDTIFGQGDISDGKEYIL